MKKYQLVLVFILSVLFLSGCADNTIEMETIFETNMKVNGWHFEKHYAKIDGCEYLVLVYHTKLSATKLDCNCVSVKSNQ